MFTPLEQTKILNAKESVKKALEDFNLTVGKLNAGTFKMHEHYFVSGGCIGSLLRAEIPKDYDVYFVNETVANDVVNLYKSDEYKNEIEVIEEKYRDVVTNQNGLCITENAMTLKNKVQVILKHYGTPEVVRATFDYVHCLPYYDPYTDKLYISRIQYDCCVNKKLIPNNGNTPEQWRTEKFKNRGYTF